MLISSGHLQKRFPGRVFISLLLLCLGVATGNCAAIFMQISGITGGSTDAGHSGWIDVLSMSHGISRPIFLSQGGINNSPASHGDLTFTKPTDVSTPLLYDAATHGGAITSVEIDFISTSPTAVLFYKVTLSQVYVSGISTSGGGSTSTDSVSLFYQKISWSYTQVDGTYTASWNRVTNTGTNNFVSADSDGDGLPDAWEMQYFGTLAYGPNDDPDHDGLSNYQEYIAGTNPNDANSVLKVTGIGLTSGQVNLTWNSVAGKTYTIYNANQVDGPYTPILTMLSAGDGQTSTNLTGSAFNQFYRVGVQQ